VAYDRNFLEADFNKLLEERDRLKAIWTYAIMEVASLNKRIKAL
jgi:hypothetical protein